MNMENKIKEIVDKLNNNSVEEFLNELDKMAASKAYIVIRDGLNPNHINTIKASGKENYQKFQDIKLRAKQSWDYDHKMATIEEVNRASANVYTLLLRLIKVQFDSYNEELIAIRSAINRIEEKVGLDVTTWDKESENENGGTNDGNVQRVEENI